MPVRIGLATALMLVACEPAPSAEQPEPAAKAAGAEAPEEPAEDPPKAEPATCTDWSQAELSDLPQPPGEHTSVFEEGRLS